MRETKQQKKSSLQQKQTTQIINKQNYVFMEKKTYVKPELETVEFAVEAGFAQSQNYEIDGDVLSPEDFGYSNAYGDDSGWR